ncbi:MAG: hypothetical protein IKC79_03045 [Clostridia bacterium]|nr:hypothetical protein [Clostridia bacterium]
MARTNLMEDVVDTKVAEEDIQVEKSLNSNDAVIKRFSTSHNTDNIEKVYSDLNVGQYFASRDKLASLREVEPQQAQKEVSQEKRKPMKNPFETKSAPKKMTTYNDIVDIPTIAPTLEVNSYSDMPIKPAKSGLGKRMKLWLVTGICCVVMLGSAITMTALNVGQSAGSNATITEIAVERGELADESGYINNTGADMNGQNMGSMDKVSGVSKPVPKPQPSSSVWDKICAFFSRIFGG